MNLIVYSYCRESDRNSNEEALKIEWLESLPDVGQSVSMGDERRWFIVKVDRYHSDQIFDVYLIHINRTLSTPVTWDCDGCENETIHIELAAVGEPILGLAFNVLGEAPRIGKRLMNYERTDHPTLMRESPNGWIVDRYDELLPDGEAPYKAVYLSWCRQLAASFS